MKLSPAKSIRGSVTVPGDKSISHRSVMLGSIARGTTEIHGFLEGPTASPPSPASAIWAWTLKTKMAWSQSTAKASAVFRPPQPPGLRKQRHHHPAHFRDPGGPGLFCCSHRRRLHPEAAHGPDHHPLSMMGADIKSIHGNGCAPLQITGKPLSGICYDSPVASAQVKSAILLAGLYAEGETRVTEPQISRNHTELMLKFFGADIRTEGSTATVRQTPELYGNRITVPGDISSAVYFAAAGMILPNSEVLIKNAGINPTRAGLLTVCKAMGADHPYKPGPQRL